MDLALVLLRGNATLEVLAVVLELDSFDDFLQLARGLVDAVVEVVRTCVVFVLTDAGQVEGTPIEEEVVVVGVHELELAGNLGL